LIMMLGSMYGLRRGTMWRLLVVGLAVCIVLPGAAWAGIVTNGGFESTDFSGWTRSGNLGDTSVVCNGGGANGSNCFASFGPVGSLGYISQTLSTVAGGTYDLTYWLYANGSGYAEFNAWWEGILVVGPVVNPNTGNVWTSYTLSGLTATGPSTELKFGLRNDPDYIDLDEIDVVASGAVPEPATTVLCGLGLAVFALLRRKR
jgi:hypothetical protein